MTQLSDGQGSSLLNGPLESETISTGGTMKPVQIGTPSVHHNIKRLRIAGICVGKGFGGVIRTPVIFLGPRHTIIQAAIKRGAIGRARVEQINDFINFLFVSKSYCASRI